MFIGKREGRRLLERLGLRTRTMDNINIDIKEVVLGSKREEVAGC
jgi:hypothetical protein